MSVFKSYLDYLSDNPKGYWFKRKIYGYGWTPATWQGWLTTFIYIGLVLLLALLIGKGSERDVTFTFILPLMLLTITFIGIAYKKGEKPCWQWGIKKK